MRIMILMIPFLSFFLSNFLLHMRKYDQTLICLVIFSHYILVYCFVCCLLSHSYICGCYWLLLFCFYFFRKPIEKTAIECNNARLAKLINKRNLRLMANYYSYYLWSITFQCLKLWPTIVFALSFPAQWMISTDIFIPLNKVISIIWGKCFSDCLSAHLSVVVTSERNYIKHTKEIKNESLK